MSGLTQRNYDDIIKQKHGGGTHIVNVLKFLTVREERSNKKSGIMCVGGPWDPVIDGEDPSKFLLFFIVLIIIMNYYCYIKQFFQNIDSDELCLIKTCIRHALSQVAVDLNGCKRWLRFCDIHFKRTDQFENEYEEITVIFLVDVKDIVPKENWVDILEEQTDMKNKISEKIQVIRISLNYKYINMYYLLKYNIKIYF